MLPPSFSGKDSFRPDLTSSYERGSGIGESVLDFPSEGEISTPPNLPSQGRSQETEVTPPFDEFAQIPSSSSQPVHWQLPHAYGHTHGQWPDGRARAIANLPDGNPSRVALPSFSKAFPYPMHQKQTSPIHLQQQYNRTITSDTFPLTHPASVPIVPPRPSRAKKKKVKYSVPEKGTVGTRSVSVKDSDGNPSSVLGVVDASLFPISKRTELEVKTQVARSNNHGLNPDPIIREFPSSKNQAAPTATITRLPLDLMPGTSNFQASAEHASFTSPDFRLFDNFMNIESNMGNTKTTGSTTSENGDSTGTAGTGALSSMTWSPPDITDELGMGNIDEPNIGNNKNISNILRGRSGSSSWMIYRPHPYGATRTRAGPSMPSRSLSDIPSFEDQVLLTSEYSHLQIHRALGSSEDERIVHLTRRLASVLKNSRSRKALCSLQGSAAQLIVEYLYKFLQQPSSSIPWLQKHALIALYRLSKSSLLYPHCYALKDIVIDSHETGGGFSDIYRGHHGDQNVCLKVVRLHQKADADALLKFYAKEAILWGQLRHCNIVPFYGIYYLNEERRQICLVSPWMQNGNLTQYLKSNPSIDRVPFIHDIAAGLEYLHSRSLIHSDLKGVNVLINDAGIACITDFGLSCIRTDQTLVYTAIATAAHGVSHNWAAPELLDDDKFPTMASDVWALGCVIYEIILGKLPFQGLSEAQIIRKLIAGTTPQRPDPLDIKIRHSLANIVWALIQRCWAIEPQGRPTCLQVLDTLTSAGFIRWNGAPSTGDDMHAGRLRFEEAMRKPEEVPLDHTAVETILDSMLAGESRGSSTNPRTNVSA